MDFGLFIFGSNFNDYFAPQFILYTVRRYAKRSENMRCSVYNFMSLVIYGLGHKKRERERVNVITNRDHDFARRNETVSFSLGPNGN